MVFRPCIDIHNGIVKQIVGNTLCDENDDARENFSSTHDATYYADMYKELGLTGGHVIILNGRDSSFYESSKAQALNALKAYPQGLQIGGGITDENAKEYIDAGASHVIVTSFVFADGIIHKDRLERLCRAVGKEHIVLDLSCRMRDGKFYIVTDRWQKFTQIEFNRELFDDLAEYCDEFLIHAVGVEGTGLGIDTDVLDILSKVPYTVTYAGGISSMEDIEDIRTTGAGHVNFTVGSCLDIFGGNLKIKEICACTQ